MDKDQFLDWLKKSARRIAMDEEHVPMLFGVLPTGMPAVAHLATLDKDSWGDAVCGFIDEVNPAFYAFVSEAYMAVAKSKDSEKFKQVMNEGVASLPPDDREDVLMITLCENDGKARLFTCKVHPENAGKRVVGDWEESKMHQVVSRHLMLKW